MRHRLPSIPNRLTRIGRGCWQTKFVVAPTMPSKAPRSTLVVNWIRTAPDPPPERNGGGPMQYVPNVPQPRRALAVPLMAAAVLGAGIATATFALVNIEDEPIVSLPTPAVESAAVPSDAVAGQRSDGGPEEGAAQTITVVPAASSAAPATRYDGGPNEGSAQAITAQPAASVGLGRGGDSLRRRTRGRNAWRGDGGAVQLRVGARSVQRPASVADSGGSSKREQHRCPLSFASVAWVVTTSPWRRRRSTSCMD